MEERDSQVSYQTETAESLQRAYSRLFQPAGNTTEMDTQSLAQPYPLRYVESVTTDRTDSTS
jgi:hypothetical protein